MKVFELFDAYQRPMSLYIYIFFFFASPPTPQLPAEYTARRRAGFGLVFVILTFILFLYRTEPCVSFSLNNSLLQDLPKCGEVMLRNPLPFKHPTPFSRKQQRFLFPKKSQSISAERKISEPVRCGFELRRAQNVRKTFPKNRVTRALTD